MAECIVLKGGGGGADLDLTTVTPADMLAGKVALGKDGKPMEGTMPIIGPVDKEMGGYETYQIPLGYHDGTGVVKTRYTQMMTTPVTPSVVKQTIKTAGKIVTNDVVINPIPSNYYDKNESQVLFSQGSFGSLMTEGAYYYKYEPNGNTNYHQKAIIEDKRIYMHMYNNYNALRFKRTIPTHYKYLIIEFDAPGQTGYLDICMRKDNLDGMERIESCELWTNFALIELSELMPDCSQATLDLLYASDEEYPDRLLISEIRLTNQI